MRHLPGKDTRGAPGSRQKQIYDYGSGIKFPTNDPTIMNKSATIA